MSPLEDGRPAGSALDTDSRGDPRSTLRPGEGAGWYDPDAVTFVEIDADRLATRVSAAIATVRRVARAELDTTPRPVRRTG